LEELQKEEEERIKREEEEKKRKEEEKLNAWNKYNELNFYRK
jgi:hypothetical protein